MKILLINGPNLNLLGSRETEKYGDLSLKELESKLRSIAEDQIVNCIASNQTQKKKLSMKYMVLVLRILKSS